MATEVVAETAAEASPAEGLSWFVMRDLKRANAKHPAYCQLQEAGFEVFTPMTTRISIRAGKRVREDVPFVRDLLFVHTTRDNLDPIVSRTATLQYRYVKGGRYLEAMTVREARCSVSFSPSAVWSVRDFIRLKKSPRRSMAAASA